MLPGFTGPINDFTQETTGDVELAIAMAPGLHQVQVYEGDPNSGCTAGDTIIADMAAATGVRQFSSSVSYCLSDNISAFDLMAATGQSFFSSSGDYGTGATGNALNYTTLLQSKVTGVGGTMLSMNGSGASYQSEQAWHFSGGGVEQYPAPHPSAPPIARRETPVARTPASRPGSRVLPTRKTAHRQPTETTPTSRCRHKRCLPSSMPLARHFAAPAHPRR